MNSFAGMREIRGSMRVISLTTDFGLADGYVGTMKGVILSICPEVTLVDISHQIRPQAIEQAAYVLSTAAPYFPPGSVHLVVVDPGVGGARRPIAVQAERGTYVAPDNGVLTLALDRDPPRQAVHLTRTEFHLPGASATFHGRDVFAPAAAHLACGRAAGDLGDPVPVSELVFLPPSRPVRQAGGTWLGRVLHVDHFGNLVTDFLFPAVGAPPCGCPGQALSPAPTRWVVEIAGVRITGLHRTFSDVETGELLAYVGSSGHLEIGLRDGDAAARLGAQIGDPVTIRRTAFPGCPETG